MGADEATDAPDDPAFERRVADARPDADELARRVLLSRVASALFGEAEPVVVGRYRLGAQLGRGGGGAVFVAEDPELHREVAVKLIRCASDSNRQRALAEGRALAKLSHPNVVPVHDVGETGQHVYLVMELLRGQSLRELAAEASVRELVAAYRQAANGLAAAHAVGLVHRDFKPDNAMLGADGRLRVVDFGLASAAGEDAAAVGTPRYMAPEQRAGGSTDAAVDQYALGVALREAVTANGRREPAWLARVIERARAERPADRYPSMDALAKALGDDPRSRWRTRLLIGVPIVIAAAGFGIGRAATGSAEPACDGGSDTLAATWTPARVAEVVARVEGIGTPFSAATASWIRGRLTVLGETWLVAHHAGCSAHERGELSDELYDRATLCLARARIGLGQAMDLVGAATSSDLDKAVSTLAVVAVADRCADPLQLASLANPEPTPAMRIVDQQIETARMHARASTPSAVRYALAALAGARTSGDPRLISRASLVLGHALMAIDRAAALAPLHDAMVLGIEHGLDEVAVEAFARHAWALARKRDPDLARALDGLDLAEAVGKRAGDRGAFARALLANNTGSVAQFRGDYPAAREAFRRALSEAATVAGPGAVELQTAVSNLALLTSDRSERTQLFARAVAQVVAAVGPDHPQSFEKQLLAISDGTDPQAVLDDLARLDKRLGTLHPSLGQLRVLYKFEIAWQASALGRRELIVELARDVPAAEPAWLRELLHAYIDLARGATPSEILARLTMIAEERTALVPKSWFQHQFAADAELSVAFTAHRSGDGPRARAAATRALRHLEAFQAVTGVPSGSIERRLAWARELAAP